MKRQAINLEKIFTTHISNIGLVYRIYKELLELNNKKTKYPNKKGQKGLKGRKMVGEEDPRLALSHEYSQITIKSS